MKRKIKVSVVTTVLFLTLTLLSAGCVEQGTSTNQIDMENNQFDPSSIEIDLGETIKFVNKDSVTHTVHITDQDGNDVFENTEVPPAENITVTIDEEGTYNLDCEIHPGMDGTIGVGQEANGENGGGGYYKVY